MKKSKLFFLILLFLLFLPAAVSAKEVCRVVSGDGKEIGSEIACGTEHFNIIESTDNEIKMLAKYNLYMGNIIDREEIVKDSTDTRTDLEYCQALATERGGTLKTTGVYDVSGYCFIEKEITGSVIKQSENALSAHWDKDGNYLYPQVGDVYLIMGYESGPNNGGSPVYIGYLYRDQNTAGKYDGMFTDYSFSTESYSYPVSENKLADAILSYKEMLIGEDFEVNDITLLTLDDINTVVKSNDKTIPYSDWHDYATDPGRVNDLGEFVFLPDYLTDKQSFLYNTTYWMRTGYVNGSTSGNVLTYSNDYILFISSRGGVCESGFNTIGSFTYCGATFTSNISKIGCGVRPVITIPNELQYLIKTVTDGNGTIDVVENSLGGEVISFRVNANKGYKLSKLVITTDSGETVEFDEGETVENADGTISIDSSKFTMPFENVTIEAKWLSETDELVPEEVEKEIEKGSESNPVTGDEVMMLLMLLFVSLGVSISIGTFLLKKEI